MILGTTKKATASKETATFFAETKPGQLFGVSAI